MIKSQKMGKLSENIFKSGQKSGLKVVNICPRDLKIASNWTKRSLKVVQKWKLI